ncbi:hypothetical protein SprV_0401485700 [Sparganum proliferum]
MEVVTVPDGVLQAAEGLAGFENAVGKFVADFSAAGEGAAQIREVVHHLQLDSVHADSRRIVGCVGWRLVHNNRLLRVDDQAKVIGGGGE